MSIKSFLFFLLVGITSVMVLLLGLFNSVSLMTIIIRIILYSIIMGALGFTLGYLIEHWGRESGFDGAKELGKSFDSFDMNKDNIVNQTAHQEINPFISASAKKMNVDPRIAAKAIQKVMHEDDE